MKSPNSLQSLAMTILLAGSLNAIEPPAPTPSPSPTPSKSRTYKISDTKDEPNPYREIKTPSKWEQFLSLGGVLALWLTGKNPRVDVVGKN